VWSKRKAQFNKKPKKKAKQKRESGELFTNMGGKETPKSLFLPVCVAHTSPLSVIPTQEKETRRESRKKERLIN